MFFYAKITIFHYFEKILIFLRKYLSQLDFELRMMLYSYYNLSVKKLGRKSVWWQFCGKKCFFYAKITIFHYFEKILTFLCKYLSQLNFELRVMSYSLYNLSVKKLGRKSVWLQFYGKKCFFYAKITIFHYFEKILIFLCKYLSQLDFELRMMLYSYYNLSVKKLGRKSVWWQFCGKKCFFTLKSQFFTILRKFSFFCANIFRNWILS